MAWITLETILNNIINNNIKYILLRIFPRKEDMSEERTDLSGIGCCNRY